MEDVLGILAQGGMVLFYFMEDIEKNFLEVFDERLTIGWS